MGYEKVKIEFNDIIKKWENTDGFDSKQIENLKGKPLVYIKEKEKLVGEVYTRLTVIGYLGSWDKKNITHYYICRCECGNIKISAYQGLRQQHTKSCGCLRRLTSSQNIRKKKQDPFLVRNKEKFFKEGTGLHTIKNKEEGVGIRETVTKANKIPIFLAFIGFKGKKIHLGTYRRRDFAQVARWEGEERYFQPTLDKYGVESSSKDLDRDVFDIVGKEINGLKILSFVKRVKKKNTMSLFIYKVQDELGNIYELDVKNIL